MSNIYDLADTWNNAGTTFTAIKMNVTDTASNAASNLLDLQVTSASRFAVRKDGMIVSGVSDFKVICPSGGGSRVFSVLDGASMALSVSGYGLVQSGYLALGASSVLPDVYLVRDAANQLGIRNGTTAQTMRVYNTFTDASNYERGYMRWSSNVFKIGAENAGTGAARIVEVTGNNDVKLVVTNATGNMGGIFTSTGTQLVTARGLGDVVILGSNLTIGALPTSSPGVSGRIWNNGGVLSVVP